ncbi:MAG: AAA family ATPase [Rhizobiaceae bacterium]
MNIDEQDSHPYAPGNPTSLEELASPKKQDPTSPKARKWVHANKVKVKPRPHLIRNLLPRATTTFISADPKCGKSYLTLQMAQCLARGTPMFNEPLHSVSEVGDTLFIDMESDLQTNTSRMKDLDYTDDDDARLAWIFQDEFGNSPDEIYCRLGQGGSLVQTIEDWHRSVENPLMVVLDTFKLCRPENNGRGDIVATDTKDVAALNILARRLNISIVLVHHNKQAKDSSVRQMAGTSGLTGTAGSICILKKVSDHIRRFSVESRYTGELNYLIEKTAERSHWELPRSYEHHVSVKGKNLAVLLAMVRLDAIKRPINTKTIFSAVPLEDQVSTANIANSIRQLNRRKMVNYPESKGGDYHLVNSSDAVIALTTQIQEEDLEQMKTEVKP